MKAARTAAVLTWIYAAGFGIPAIPVAVYLWQNGFLPSFLGLFPVYGGPWSARFEDGTVAALLIAFFFVTLAVAWSAWLLWKGTKTGGVLGLVLLPVEAVFWYGFALPFPLLIGLARAALIAVAWRSLGRRAPNDATTIPG